MSAASFGYKLSRTPVRVTADSEVCLRPPDVPMRIVRQPVNGGYPRSGRQSQPATGPVYRNRARTVAFPCPSHLVPTPRPHRFGGFGLRPRPISLEHDASYYRRARQGSEDEFEFDFAVGSFRVQYYCALWDRRVENNALLPRACGSVEPNNFALELFFMFE